MPRRLERATLLRAAPRHGMDTNVLLRRPKDMLLRCVPCTGLAPRVGVVRAQAPKPMVAGPTAPRSRVGDSIVRLELIATLTTPPKRDQYPFTTSVLNR